MIDKNKNKNDGNMAKYKDAHFVSVWANSIVSNFNSEVCGQVAVPEGQIAVRDYRGILKLHNRKQLAPDNFIH